MEEDPVLGAAALLRGALVSLLRLHPLRKGTSFAANASLAKTVKRCVTKGRPGMSEFRAWYNEVRAQLDVADDRAEVYVSVMWTVCDAARVVWVDRHRRIWRPDSDRNVLTCAKRKL
jgi:hypothetical protein